MEIGNIVSKDKIDVGIEFKVYNSFDEIINKDLPTLIVGHGLAKEIIVDELDLLNRKSGDNLFWTFTKKEFRNKYFNDLEDFLQFSYENSVKKISYIYVDLIQFDNTKIRKIVRKILTLKNIYSFYLNKMVFIYSENLIFGIDLELFKYIGVDSNRILDKIKTRSNVFLQGNEILIEYKDYMDRLDGKVYLIPFIYSISNHE